MEMRIYIANLAAYTNGELVGEWVNLPCSNEELQEQIDSILEAWNDGFGPSEEWAIHDYELPFKISEYTNPFKVNEWAEIINNSGIEEEVVKAILDNFPTVEDGLTIIENGEYRTWNDCIDMADVAYALYAETGQLAELEKVISSSYIDWEAIGRDLEIEGTFLKVNYDTFIELTE